MPSEWVEVLNEAQDLYEGEEALFLEIRDLIEEVYVDKHNEWLD